MSVKDDINLEKKEFKKLVKLQFGYLDEAIKGKDLILIDKIKDSYVVGNRISFIIITP